MHVVIRSVQDAASCRFGVPAIHTLPKESGVEPWISQAEYRLPDGYTVVESGAHAGIFNAAGHRCPLVDNIYIGGRGGTPVLIDRDRPGDEQVIHLSKVCNLTFELLKNRRNRKC